MEARISDTGYSTSSGNSTNTGPGTPDIASQKARRSVGTMSRTVLHVAAYFTMGFSTLS